MANKILIVDDEEAVRNTLRDLLRKEDYTVLAVESGEEAIEAIKKEDFDAVLMDVKLTGMSGLEAFDAEEAFKNENLTAIESALKKASNIVIMDPGTNAFLVNSWPDNHSLKLAMLAPSVQTVDEYHLFLQSQDAAIISNETKPIIQGDKRIALTQRVMDTLEQQNILKAEKKIGSDSAMLGGVKVNGYEVPYYIGRRSS